MLCSILLIIRIFVLCNLCYCDAYYLDDVVAIKKEEGKQFNRIEKLKYDFEIIEVVSVKNSDWSDCPLSDNFLSLYNSEQSIIKDYNVIRVFPIAYDNKKVKGKFKRNKYLLNLLIDDNKKIPCIFYVIRNNKNEVDDILTYVIPEEKMHLNYEEMYGLAFND